MLQPFYSAGNSSFTLDGLNIKAQNTRYCVHDEHGGQGVYHHTYKNCIMHYTNTYSSPYYVQCIGGGLGQNGYISIEGGMYTSEPTYAYSGQTIDSSTQPITYHNGNNANALSKIFIKDVYLTGKGHFRFGDYGPSTNKTPVLITGCRMGMPTTHAFENQEFSVVNFEITESRDWTDPYRIVVPMSPSKSVIYLRTLDADTKKIVGGATYEVIAEEDIVTLDGTVRVKAGTKVCDIKCDKSGNGASPKLYFGKYLVKQKTTAKYYAVTTEPLSVNLDYLEVKDKIYDILCSKTRKELTLVDEETKEPIASATFTVTGKGEVKTNDKGRFLLTDLEKNQPYTITLTNLPSPYRVSTKEITFKVDKNGLIDGKETSATEMTAYIIRLTVSARDQLFGNEITSSQIRLYDANDNVVEEWTATGDKELFTDLEPGTYTLEVGGDKANRQSINLKDAAGNQNLEVIVWTFWDTAAMIGAIVAGILILVLIVGLIRSRKKKKDEEA